MVLVNCCQKNMLAGISEVWNPTKENIDVMCSSVGILKKLEIKTGGEVISRELVWH